MRLPKSLVFLTMAVALISATALPSVASTQTCKVTDPTSTPLNVRATPNGKIIGKLKNGTKVEVLGYEFDERGRAWALVINAKTHKRIGWVFREFISCY